MLHDIGLKERSTRTMTKGSIILMMQYLKEDIKRPGGGSNSLPALTPTTSIQVQFI